MSSAPGGLLSLPKPRPSPAPIEPIPRYLKKSLRFISPFPLFTVGQASRLSNNSLYMARPAIAAVFNVPFGMAIKTPPHLQRGNAGYPVHGLHGSVACLALYSGLYMPFMREIYVVRKVMDLDPLHGFFFIPIRREFLYLGRIGFNDRMPTHALPDARNAGDP